MLFAFNAPLRSSPAAALAAAAAALLSLGSVAQAAPCSDRFDPRSQVLSNGFGYDLSNTRNKPSPISSSNVASLQFAWVHAAPGEEERRTAPVVTQQAVIVAAGTNVIAMNRKTGCTYWTASVDATEKFLVGANKARSSSLTYVNEPYKTPMVYVGDFFGKVYGFDARDGRLVWSKFMGSDENYNSITGGFQYYDGKLFVPVSSREVYQLIIDVFKPCCTSYGILHAVDAATGKTFWRYNTVAKQTYNILTGNKGPNGMPIWTTPTIDPVRKQIYVGTGQNYSSPATYNSDSMIALDLNTGKEKWVFQAYQGDTWNGACRMPPLLDGKCPKTPGKDFDFGAPAILTKTSSGSDILLAGSKNGTVYALNPSTGAKIWERTLGVGQTLGGVHWGMAVDRSKLYVSITDLYVNKLVRFNADFNADFDENMRVADGGKPGLYALDIDSGSVVWEKHLKRTVPVTDENGNTSDKEFDVIFSAALSVTNDVLFAAGLDGVVRAFTTSGGDLLWSYNTAIAFTDVNGQQGKGGSSDSVGPIIAGSDVFVNSGYETFGDANGWQGGYGNGLFVFRLKGY